MTATAHALVRWLERVEGVDLTEARSELRASGADPENPGALLQHLWRTQEINSFDIAKRMLTPLAKAAIRAGATRVRIGKAVLQIEGGVVVTVLTARMRAYEIRRNERASAIVVNNWKPRMGFNRENLRHG